MELDAWQPSLSFRTVSYNEKFTYFFSGVDGAIKLRPRENELHELGPDFELRWRNFFANKPDKPIVWMQVSTRYSFNQLKQVTGNSHISLV